MNTHHLTQRGFTLVELLIVLVILVATTTIALRSLGGVTERQAFDRTQQQLEEVRVAIVGTLDRHGAFTPGFLSDMGRLPAPSGDPDRLLRDLWVLPAGAVPHRLAVDSIDPAVRLAVGWRGPYVQLAPGSDRVLDGFGAPLELVVSQGVWSARSLGADGLVGGTGFDTDAEVVLQDASLSIDRVVGELAGAVLVQSDPGVPNWSVQVCLYEPDALTGDLSVRFEDTDVETPNLTAFPVTFQYAFTGGNASTAGTRVVRAYVYEVGQDPRRVALRLSPPLTIVLRPGAANFDLVVP